MMEYEVDPEAVEALELMNTAMDAARDSMRMDPFLTNEDKEKMAEALDTLFDVGLRCNRLAMTVLGHVVLGIGAMPRFDVLED